jgi:hypothetical protein
MKSKRDKELEKAYNVGLQDGRIEVFNIICTMMKDEYTSRLDYITKSIKQIGKKNAKRKKTRK